jgi:putative phosphoesterase
MDDRMLHHLKSCDEVWHLGDVGDPSVIDALESVSSLRLVWGNIDGQAVRTRSKEFEIFRLEGLKFILIHIAGPLGKYTPQLRKLLQSERPDVLVCGHSHILRIKRDERFNLMYLNPGAAGKHGFHKVRTLCRFTIDDGKLTDFEVVELGPRSTQAVD